MASDPNSWQQEELIKAQTIVNLVYGSLTFLVYDHLLTLDEEIRHMWSRLDFGRTLFFLNRYGVPIELVVILYGFLTPNPTSGLCRGWYIFQEFSSLASLAVVQVTLMMRTWVLWGGTRLLLFILSIFLLSCLYATAVILVFISYGTDFQIGPSTSMTGCVTLTPPDKHLWTFWIPIITFDTVICAMTVVKVVQHRRQDVHGALVDILHRDGLTYFALSLTLSVINVVIFAIAPVQLKAIALPLISSTLCATCSRLLLNVRSVGNEVTGPPPSETSLMPITFEMNVLSRPDLPLSPTSALATPSLAPSSPGYSPRTPMSTDSEAQLLPHHRIDRFSRPHRSVASTSTRTAPSFAPSSPITPISTHSEAQLLPHHHIDRFSRPHRPVASTSAHTPPSLAPSSPVTPMSTDSEAQFLPHHSFDHEFGIAF